MRLVAAETRKLVYQRSFWAMLILASLLSVLSTVTSPIAVEEIAPGYGGLDDPNLIDGLYANAISGYVFAMLIGILIVAGDFRHGTAVATYVAVPKRGRVFLAKAFTALIGGAVMQAVATPLGLLSGYLTLNTFFPEAAEPSQAIFLNTGLAALISGATLGVLGASFASLIRSQVVATLGAILWLFAVEPIFLTTVPDQGKYFLIGLITGIMSLDIENSDFNYDSAAFFDPVTSVALLGAYALALGLVSLIVNLRRDIE